MPSYWYIIDRFVDIMFLIDMIFTFRTALIDEYGKIDTNFKNISKAYFAGWFIIDLFATLPLDLIEYAIGIYLWYYTY